MSIYGLKIHSVEAAVIYEYNRGLRDKYEYSDAMFTNSLLSDYLKSVGLRTHHDVSTRDIICVKFNFGCGSYEENLKRIDKQIASCEDEKRIKSLEIAREKVEKNKDKYRKIKVDELRKIFYEEGFTVCYKDKNKSEEIKYRLFYRTPGKAKIGEAMFINVEYYERAIEWIRMGIQLPENDAPIVEIGAYQSLSASTITGKIRIDPAEILVIKDVDSFFNTEVISIELDENKQCIAKTVKDYRLKNTMFDGQALIDESIFPSWANGYILLRHHFCKMAAFSSNIQQFFKDYFGDEYDDAEVTDYWGKKHLAKDIKLITTENAMKWMKFGVSYEYWSDWVYSNGCNFGIVKTAHESKIGNLQRMSYQMVNALSLPIMDKVCSTSLNYIKQLKEDDEFFLQFLRNNINFVNDFEVLLALVRHNPDFIQSDYFKDRRYSIISNYGANIRNGKLLQEGDNLVILGSPYAMLLHSVGEDPLLDPTFDTEDDAIQCYTERFEDGEYLAEFRSPFNSYFNLGRLHNCKHELLKRYINIGKQCIAVNLNHTNFQDKNNGSDQDSDSIYVTNQPEICDYAKHCMLHCPTPVNNIPRDKTHYKNSPEDMAIADHKLMEANTAIGESSNLAQLCLTYSHNSEDKLYKDSTAILAILAQIAIDNAKRAYAVDLNSEISRIKKELNIDKNGYPQFWFNIKRKNKFSKEERRTGGRIMKNCNPSLVCPMNYCYDLTMPRNQKLTSTIPFAEFLIFHELDVNRRRCKKVEDIIQKYQLESYYAKVGDESYDYDVLGAKFEELIEELKQINLSGSYAGMMCWLIRRAFIVKDSYSSKSILWRNKGLLLTVLYKSNPRVFMSLFMTQEQRENCKNQSKNE